VKKFHFLSLNLWFFILRILIRSYRAVPVVIPFNADCQKQPYPFQCLSFIKQSSIFFRTGSIPGTYFEGFLSISGPLQSTKPIPGELLDSLDHETGYLKTQTLLLVPVPRFLVNPKSPLHAWVTLSHL